MIQLRPTVPCLLLLAVSLSYGLSIGTVQNPPFPSQHALMARYVIHNSDWLSISTISTLSNARGYPFVNLKSTSDGPRSKGTGTPYLYMTDMDLSGKDVNQDNRVSILTSLADNDYCQSRKYDPQDPRCPRVILTGRLVRVAENSTEHDFAQNSLFERHPVMKSWPVGHEFYVAKVEIEHVILLDAFGGANFVSVEDYFNANGPEVNLFLGEITAVVISV